MAIRAPPCETSCRSSAGAGHVARMHTHCARLHSQESHKAATHSDVARRSIAQHFFQVGSEAKRLSAEWDGHPVCLAMLSDVYLLRSSKDCHGVESCMK